MRKVDAYEKTGSNTEERAKADPEATALNDLVSKMKEADDAIALCTTAPQPEVFTKAVSPKIEEHVKGDGAEHVKQMQEAAQNLLVKIYNEKDPAPKPLHDVLGGSVTGNKGELKRWSAGLNAKATFKTAKQSSAGSLGLLDPDAFEEGVDELARLVERALKWSDEYKAPLPENWATEKKKLVLEGRTTVLECKLMFVMETHSSRHERGMLKLEVEERLDEVEEEVKSNLCKALKNLCDKASEEISIGA